MASERQTILFAPEAEAIIEHFEVFDVKDIGCQRWAQQHENFQRINMQAILHASQNEDEFVKEYLITYEKIPALVKDLIATEVWKQNIFPKFAELQLEPKSSFPIYIVLLHECTVLNLLETVMYHKEACESADDLIIDLMDYCYRKLTALIARCEEISDVDDDDDNEKEITIDSIKSTESSLDELQKQFYTIEFNIATKALAVLRFIADHSSSLSLSVLSRLLNIHDVPLLITQLMETAPWTRKRKGKLEKFVDLNWQPVDERDRFTLTKIEGQMWLTLFPLLMREECQRKYELDSYKKNCLLRLRAYMNEMLLDQLPVLVEMQRYLEQLSMMEPPPVKKELLLEQVPEVREEITRANEGKWSKIAKKQMKTFFNPSKVDLRSQARRLAEAYDLDTLENFIAEPPKCVVCGEAASKRCSRCQQEWYCRRECQVSHWKKHKKACDLYVDAKKKADEIVQNAAEMVIS